MAGRECVMTTAERIRLCRIIEKIERNKEYAENLKVKNVSRFYEKETGEDKGQENEY